MLIGWRIRVFVARLDFLKRGTDGRYPHLRSTPAFSARIWTRNADKLRFWTENPDMFVAPFTAVGLFNLAANRRTSGARSGAYAHIRKLHGLTGELTVWPAIADFDSQKGFSQ